MLVGSRLPHLSVSNERQLSFAYISHPQFFYYVKIYSCSLIYIIYLVNYKHKLKMSFLSKVFGGKKGDKAPTTGEAIQKLRETEDMLIKKQEFLEKKIEHELGVARANGTKNKRGLSSSYDVEEPQLIANLLSFSRHSSPKAQKTI